jgi:hypothetical protein
MTANLDEGLTRLDPRSIDVDRVGWWIATAVISGVLLLLSLISLFTLSHSWLPAVMILVWAGFTVLHVWLTLRWPELAFRHTGYRVDDRGIEIHIGVYWRRRIAVPRSRVQHIDVTQGPLQRSHGLGTLVIVTAGSEHARVMLAGLAYPRALALRDQLLPGDDDDAI